jgi:predicted 3-demethylubiquinone-9 3-methyltransferase (glyoxalase superfamily)
MFKEGGEAAITYYVSLFRNSKIHSMSSNGSALMHASFELEGQRFLAMDGGPHFRFEQGFSLFVDCRTQEEVDRLWEELSEGGEKEQCGWVKDRWGISWQVVPSILGKLLGDKDPAKAKRVMDAMLKMRKLIIKELQYAYDGK